jgi:hypothetical protein
MGPVTVPPIEPAADEVLLDARELVGLLADADRRAVVAALVLGAPDEQGARRDAGLDARRFAKALHRLVDAGLVLRDGDGTLHLLAESFRLAARAEAARHAPPDEHTDAPAEVARVLRAFVRDGRLVSIPSVASKRRVVLDWLAQGFEPGRQYTEADVNAALRRVHPDTAALRRYLVDEGFLARARGEYWRTGGTFDPAR